MQMNMALYRLLLKVGANELEAEAAAQRLESDLVTKADLTVAVQELKADLLKWTIGLLFTALGLQTAFLLFVVTHYKP
jgi:hypothetical protein